MEKYLYFVLFFISSVSHSSYLEYIEFRNNSSSESACAVVDKYFNSTTDLYEKVYFLKAKNGCYYRSEDFKKFSRDEKKVFFKENGQILSKYLKNALDSNENPDKDLLDLVGVSEHYPKLYERLEKKKIKAYMERPVVAPDENEGDVHSVSYFVASDYKNMIHRYLENDMPEDAERLAKEYGQYPWAGDHGIKQMQEEIKIHQAIIEKNRKNKENKVVEKADPKKVTAELTKALQEFKEIEKIEPKDQIKNAVEKQQIVDEILQEDSILERYWLFVLAIIIMFLMYFNSRRKVKK
jgi:hypothetical protein